MARLEQIDSSKKRILHALEATNFFLADVQTGLGPFLAAYLAGSGWEPGRVGVALTLGGIVTVALQVPAGAIVDRLRSKRLILAIAGAVLAVGAILLSITAAPWAVYTSQTLIGGAGPFLGPTLAAVTMGIVGVTFFDLQFGINQSFNSAGHRSQPAGRNVSFAGVLRGWARQNRERRDSSRGRTAHATQARERDQMSVVEAGPEDGLLGTQLGPNKNGKKW